MRWPALDGPWRPYELAEAVAAVTGVSVREIAQAGRGTVRPSLAVRRATEVYAAAFRELSGYYSGPEVAAILRTAVSSVYEAHRRFQDRPGDEQASMMLRICGKLCDGRWGQRRR